MTPTGRRQSADAVVVGAGHNGLVAANLLADAGWDVVVLEATARPRRRGPLRRGHRARLPQRPVQLVLPARVRLAGAARPRPRRATGCAGGTPRTCWPTCCPTVGPRCSTATRTRPRRRWRRSRRATASAGCDAYDDWLRGRRADAATPSPRRSRRCAAGSACCAGCGSPGRCGWPGGWCVPVRKLGDELFDGDGRAGAAGRLRPAHRPVPGRGRLRRCTAGCWPCSASRSAGRCRTAGRRRSPTRWWPG